MQLTLCREEGDGGSLRTGTTGSPNAMDVVLRIVRIVVVQHMGNVTDILREQVSISVSRRAPRRPGKVA